MKELIGSPGTVSGLTLRIAQCAFAAASIGVMVSTSDFSTYTAFCKSCLELSVCVRRNSWKTEQSSMEPFCYYMSCGDGSFLSHLFYVFCLLRVIAVCAVLIFRCTMSLGKEKKLVSYLIASMGLQLLWSFGLACLDVYALRRKRDLQNPVLVSLFVVGDWVTAMLSLAAACSSAGVIVLYARDLDFCRAQAHLPCRRYEISIILAFITWVLIAMSSHVMFWILASF
ncbi:hypothetical protein SCA6_001433 [Theobroma cacao]